jgi:eukaryotic-like serine/threonine-protein kinase
VTGLNGDPFPGGTSQRYEIVRRIGAGGMGVVYEAVDRRTAQHVALKALLKVDAASLYRFKREFRSLAGVHHRNLVRLHELIATEGDPFFTMELVDGVTFLEHVREGGRAPGEATQTTDISDPRRASADTMPPAADAVERSASPANIEKLRPALRQLVEGLDALHRAGKVHRDVKPSNVLVARDGRVVLLDFGIATDLHRARGVSDADSDEGNVVGTPTYMAPEQVTSEAPTAASDMYSVGVMLYEALVGRPPFEGTALDVMARKMTLTPLATSEFAEGIPRDLDDLCSGLLQIDPAKRLRTGAILRTLGSTMAIRSDAPGRRAAALLVGREVERQALSEAYGAARAGQAVTVRVSGAGGMGKSALVQSFVDDLLASGQTNVLCGRAYERESVPYKAIDGVVDALSQLLVGIDNGGGGFAIPRHAHALTRLFPVLRRVPGIGDERDAVKVEPQTERRHALRALRECLGSLARRRPLVVFIDDVQWGDTDSVALLVEVMRPPRPPPLLLVMTARDEDAEASAFLAEMAATWPGDVGEIRVGPLGDAEARRLVVSLLDPSDPEAERKADAIVHEARGSPLLIEELVRSHGHHGGAQGATLAALTLEQMVSRRLDELTPEVRRLAETIAVAGRPLPLTLVAVAAGLEKDVAGAIEQLQTQGLARAGFRNDREVAEPVHDRIREAIVALLSPALLREHHDHLASALEMAPGADLEAWAVHLLGAGDPVRAAAVAERAAEQAAAKLAFDHAARLLRMVLSTMSESGAETRRVRVRLAETLVRAGRASAAADEYARAAKSATAIERVELERAAAEQLLWCGRVDEGEIALRRVLDAMGMTAPRSAIGALLLFLFYRLWLRVRGLRMKERDAADVSPADRVRIDTLRAVSAALGSVDLILGACMQSKHLLVAMDRGDRMQVLFALRLELVQFATEGRPEGRRERQVLALARGLAVGIGPEAESVLSGTLGLASYLRGRYRDALERFDVATRAVPGADGAALARLFATFSCFFLGRLREEKRRARRLLRDVEERGDVYTAVSLRSTIMVDIALVDDDPAAARRQLRDAVARWPQRGFLVQHWYAMWSEANIHLYAGEGALALARLERDERALRRSFLLHSQMIRGFTAYLRACCAIASIDAAPDVRARRVSEARRAGRRLRRENAAWGPTLAAIVEAATDNAAGRRDAAVASLREALGNAQAADLALHAWAIRHQLGKAIGDDEGREHVAEAERAMTDEGIRSPQRMANMIVPGRWS